MDKANTKALDDPHSSVAYDLWNKKDAKKEKAKEIVGKNLAGFIDQVTKNYDWKVPKHIIKKPSELPAIEVPLPGTSYNPTYHEHQELLQKALTVEVEKEKKEKKII